MSGKCGNLEVFCHDGLIKLKFEEHPRGDGSLRIVLADEPLCARDLRAAAEALENHEKRLARERAETGDES
jgi:hypothetical protein